MIFTYKTGRLVTATTTISSVYSSLGHRFRSRHVVVIYPCDSPIAKIELDSSEVRDIFLTLWMTQAASALAPIMRAAEKVRAKHFKPSVLRRLRP